MECQKSDMAQRLISKNILNNPTMLNHHYNIGLVHIVLGKKEKAVQAFQEAILIKPDYAEAYYNLGLIFKDQGRLEDAVDNFKKAARFNPDDAATYYNLGNTFKALNQAEKSIESYMRALEIKPDYAEAYNNMGLALKDLGLIEEAVENYNRAVHFKPDFTEAFYNLGNAFKDLSKHDKAISCYQKALEIKPDYADALNNMGNVFHGQGNLLKAITYYSHAAKANSCHIEAYNNLGKTYNELGNLGKAILYYNKAHKIDPGYPEVHFNRSFAYLIGGKFSEGWKGYEWRFKRKEWKSIYPHHFEKPRWDGLSFAGKRLFIHSEQGFGDTLQFIRYLPMVKALGGEVIFETMQPLIGILKEFPGIDRLVEMSSEFKTREEFDFYVPLMSLPGIFGTTLETIPADVPYLFADSQKVKYWQRRLDGSVFKIGIVWAGSPTYKDEKNRSCGLKQFIPLSKLPGIRLYGLQKGEAAGQIDTVSHGNRIINLGEEFEDFSDTAAVIEHMDLVISTDTGVIHLAGAMGKPVWALLSFVPDWRWLLERKDSPWYPTMRLFRQIKYGDWETVFRHIAKEIHKLVAKPDHSDSLHLFGVLAHQKGDNNLGEEFIAKAIRINPEIPIYYVSLGDVFKDLGDLDGAISQYNKALKLNPDLVEAHCNMGNTFCDLKSPERAIECFQKAIAIKPDLAEAYNNLGTVYYDLKRNYEAFTCYKKALSLKPDYAEAFNNMGNVFKEQHEFDEAVVCYNQAVTLQPKNPDLYYNLGSALFGLSRLEEAIECYKKAVTLNPDYDSAFNNMGKCFHDKGNLKDAIVCYNKSIIINPAYASAHFNRALAHLITGNFKEGWKGYEWRFKREEWKKIYPHRFEKPRWDGLSFAGKKLFVHSEQGFGDTLQFIRYLPMVKALGGEVIFETMQPLIGLLKNFPGIDMLVVMSSDNKPLEDFDFHVPLMSLPEIFGTTLDTIPADVPYIPADTQKAKYWNNRLNGSEINIGIVWAGKPTYKNDKNRSFALEHFYLLSKLNGVKLYGLQKGKAAGQVNKLSADNGVINIGDELEDFSDTAGIIENLDLVIAVDTAVAHLAGAMGKPVWVLLPFIPDWRWLLKRDDSPWYPTMRLFRQKEPGDWNGVFSFLSEELKAIKRNRLM